MAYMMKAFRSDATGNSQEMFSCFSVVANLPDSEGETASSDAIDVRAASALGWLPLSVPSTEADTGARMRIPTTAPDGHRREFHTIRRYIEGSHGATVLFGKIVEAHDAAEVKGGTGFDGSLAAAVSANEAICVAGCRLVGATVSSHATGAGYPSVFADDCTETSAYAAFIVAALDLLEQGECVAIGASLSLNPQPLRSLELEMRDVFRFEGEGVIRSGACGASLDDRLSYSPDRQSVTIFRDGDWKRERACRAVEAITANVLARVLIQQALIKTDICVWHLASSSRECDLGTGWLSCNAPSDSDSVVSVFKALLGNAYQHAFENEDGGAAFELPSCAFFRTAPDAVRSAMAFAAQSARVLHTDKTPDVSARMERAFAVIREYADIWRNSLSAGVRYALPSSCDVRDEALRLSVLDADKARLARQVRTMGERTGVYDLIDAVLEGVAVEDVAPPRNARR